MAVVTWNPSDKHADLVLSNGNLTVTANGTGDKGLRATEGKSFGKWYWEIIACAALSYTNFVGIGTSAASIASGMYLGEDANGYSYRDDDGKKYNNNVGVAYGNEYVGDDVISVALDMDNGKVWFAINGVWQNSGDPAAGTGEAFSGLSGTFFPMVSIYWNTLFFTANFGSSAFSYSIPSGFGEYEERIELVATLPQIVPFLGGGGSLTPSIPAIEPFLGGGGLIGATLPKIIPIMEGSDNINHGDVTAELPLITPSITEATSGDLSVTLPIITAKIGIAAAGDVDATLPAITAEILCGIGSFLEVDIPLITADIVSGALFDVDIPVITASIEGLSGETCELVQTLPTITANVTGKVGILGSIDVSIPMLQAYTTGLIGKIITCTVTLPSIQASIVGYDDLLHADLDATLALISAYMVGTPARFEDCVVLRYTEPV